MSNVFNLNAIEFRGIFERGVVSIEPLFFPNRCFTIRVIKIRIDNWCVRLAQLLRRMVVRSSPTVFNFQKIFMVISGGNSTFYFRNRATVVGMVRCRGLGVFMITVLHVLIRITGGGQQGRKTEQLVYRSPFSFEVCEGQSYDQFNLPYRGSVQLKIATCPPRLPNLSASFPVR